LLFGYFNRSRMVKNFGNICYIPKTKLFGNIPNFYVLWLITINPTPLYSEMTLILKPISLYWIKCNIDIRNNENLVNYRL